VSIPARETIESTHVLRMMTDALRQLPDGKYVLRVEGYWHANIRVGATHGTLGGSIKVGRKDGEVDLHGVPGE